MKTNGRTPTLVLTGDRQREGYGMIISGQEARLSEALFKAFLALVRARLSSGSEFVPLSPTHVCRIRQALGKVIGEEEGYGLIEDGHGSTYALTVDRSHITVADRFRTCPLPGDFLKRTRTAILRSADRRSKERRSSVPRSKTGRKMHQRT